MEKWQGLIAVYVLVPLLLMVGVIILLYFCCSKRYKLNWFERTILEAHEEAREKEHINVHPSAAPSSVMPTHAAVHRLSSTPKYAPLAQESGSFGSMISTPSTSDSKAEPFWVPAAVANKKRAQSLIPTIMHHADSEETVSSYGATGRASLSDQGNHSDASSPHHLHSHQYSSGGSPSKTPTSSTSLQEMTFSFPVEKLTETVSMVQVPSSAQRQRRRASMQDALDHTKINASLYEHTGPIRQQSIGSIQEENLGSLNFSLEYNREQALLCVRLIQAHSLNPHDFSGTADPYCRLCLLPKSKTTLQSKVHKKTLSPEFEEEFIFEVLPNDLSSRTLEILVFDFDQFSRDECIGQVQLPLENVDLSERVTLWKGISQFEKPVPETESLGDLMFSLGYLSSAERLTVVVLKCRNVRQVEDGKNTANPFVKVSLIYAGKRLKKKKTTTVRNTTNPTWNEALVFSLAKEFLSKIYVEFIVYNDSLIGNNEILGRVLLGPDSSGEEFSHWNDMVNAKSAVARWHHLTLP